MTGRTTGRLDRFDVDAKSLVLPMKARSKFFLETPGAPSGRSSRRGTRCRDQRIQFAAVQSS
jgi:hypothetical protein